MPHGLPIRLEIPAPRKRPETTERLLAVDDICSCYHLTHVYPRPPTIIRRGRLLKIRGGQVAGCLLQANEPHPLVFGSLTKNCPARTKPPPMIELTIDNTAFVTTPTSYPEPRRVAPLILAASRSIAKGANQADLGSAARSQSQRPSAANKDATVCNHPVMEVTLRVEILPDDPDTTVDFYTNILGFSVTKDERAEPSAYVSLQRGSVRFGAARRAVPDVRVGRLPPSSAEVMLEVDDAAAERQSVLTTAGLPLDEDLRDRPGT